MNVLIFGGNRFVGKALSEVLINKDYYVDVFNRSGTSANDKIKIIQGDRNKSEDIEKIDFTKYDCIVDMCLFFPNQFDLVKDKISKETNYIFVSSGAADYRYIDSYGDYGKDKLAVEELLEFSDLNYEVIRPSYIVGVGNHRPRLGHYINCICEEKPIKIDGDGNNEINLVFVQDVVGVLERLVDIETHDAKVIDVCGNENFSVISLINKINNYYGRQLNIDYNQEDAILPKNNFVFDNTQTCINLDMTFTDFDKGLKQYIEWHRGQHETNL
jgi:nucleoside-diphosphate-sugar epimerase